MFFNGRERLGLIILLTVVALGAFVLIYRRQSGGVPAAGRESEPFYRMHVVVPDSSRSVEPDSSGESRSSGSKKSKGRKPQKQASVPKVINPLADTISQK